MEDKKVSFYTLEERLGSGGMGEVWKAIDSRLARPVALKFLPASLNFDDESKARFIREARAASILNHPNIVTIFEAGEQDRRLFLAMELIEGVTVRDLITTGACSLQKSLDIVRQALAGLGAAHQAGIVHRDIKPENLMVRRDGYVKILDFGLARFISEDQGTLTQGIVGTPRYMSPEQAGGDSLDERSDLFSLGSVLYEMLGGTPPFSGENIHQLLSAILTENPPPPAGIPQELAAIVMKSLSKERASRYTSAGEFMEALIPYTSGSIEIPRTSPEPSLVVVPFSCSSEDDPFADGIVDEIISRLSRMKKLRVIARTTSMKLKNQNLDAREIGRVVNVNLVLEGSIRRSGERVRAMAQLVNARDGFQSWNGCFEVRTRDLFDMEDEISGAIVGELKKEFTSIDTLEHRASSPDTDSIANELYFKGASLMTTLRFEDTQKAVEFLSKAVEQAPGFASARARLSEALVLQYGFLIPEAPPELLARGKQEAEEAIRLDPGNPDACVSLGIIAMNNMDSPTALGWLRKALDISPGHVEAMSWLSYVLITCGQCEEGALLARRAIQRDPAGVNHYVWLGYALISQGRYLEAADALDRALRIDSRNLYPYGLLLWANLALNRLEEARIMHDYLVLSKDERPLIQTIMGLYRQIVENPSEFPVSGSAMEKAAFDPDAERVAADICAVRGDVVQALQFLGSSMEKGLLNLAFLDTDPFLASLRSLPEFFELRESLKLQLNELEAMSSAQSPRT